MDSLFNSIAGQFGDETLGAVADAAGFPRETAGAAFASATPAILSALASKASQPDGAAGLMRIFGTLTSMGASHPATMISGLLNDPRAMNAGFNMAHSLFGDSFGTVTGELATKTGIDEIAASKVLGTITPAIMGAVGTHVKTSGMDAAGLSGLLKGGVDSLAVMPAVSPGRPIAAAPAMPAQVPNAPSAPPVMSAPPVAPTPPVPPVSPAPASPSLLESNALDLNLDAEAAQAIAGKLGLPEGTVQQIAPVVAGVVLMALGRMAKQPDGLKQIGSLIDQAGQAGLTQISAAEAVKQSDPAKSAGMLGSLIGENTLENVADNFGRKTGITSEQAVGLLGVGVPVVLGQLGRVQAAHGADTAGLAKAITEKVAGMKNAGELTYILENVPGISDNVKRGLRKLFGRS